MQRTKHDQHAPRSGLSLIEVAISSLLVGLVLVAALNTAGGAAQASRVNDTLMGGRVYALEMLAEVMAAAYHDPESGNAQQNFGIEADEPNPPPNRLAFDDVDDYDGWIEPSALAWRNGAARLDTANWQRSVEVEKTSRHDPTHVRGDNAYDRGARLITVTVVSPDGEATTLKAIRTAGGALEQPPAIDMLCVAGVVVEVQTATASASDAAAIMNHAGGP
ncbi:MAG: hypothetical protein AAGB00_09430 [Planctomycetota bacterium]